MDPRQSIDAQPNTGSISPPTTADAGTLPPAVALPKTSPPGVSLRTASTGCACVAAVTGRAAGAGPVHPHRRRTSASTLPALAAGLCELVHRHSVAGPEPQTLDGFHGWLRQSRAPLWQDQRASQRQDNCGEPRHEQRIITALLMAPWRSAPCCSCRHRPFSRCGPPSLAGLWEWTRLVGMRKRAACPGGARPPC